MPETAQNEDVKAIAANRRARHEYWIEETHEAGIALTGTEVKSLREGRVNLTDAFARVDRGEVWLPDALERKYANAAREFGWQYLFPASRLAVDSRAGSSDGIISMSQPYSER